MLMLTLAVAGDDLVPVEGDWGKLLLMACVAVEEREKVVCGVGPP